MERKIILWSWGSSSVGRANCGLNDLKNRLAKRESVIGRRFKSYLPR